jgi:hypothetical protein
VRPLNAREVLPNTGLLVIPAELWVALSRCSKLSGVGRQALAESMLVACCASVIAEFGRQLPALEGSSNTFQFVPAPGFSTPNVTSSDG